MEDIDNRERLYMFRNRGYMGNLCTLHLIFVYCCLLLLSHQVVSDSLRPSGLQCARLPCPLPSPGVCSSSRLLSSWCHPTISLFITPSPPAINLSQHQVFSSELALRIRWPKYWSFSFNINPSNEYSGLISFRIDWFDLAVQGTLRSVLQHHNLKGTPKWMQSSRQ